MNEDVAATIKSAIAENDTHQRYIERCQGLLAAVFPLDAAHFAQSACLGQPYGGIDLNVRC